MNRLEQAFLGCRRGWDKNCWGRSIWATLIGGLPTSGRCSRTVSRPRKKTPVVWRAAVRRENEGQAVQAHHLWEQPRIHVFRPQAQPATEVHLIRLELKRSAACRCGKMRRQGVGGHEQRLNELVGLPPHRRFPCLCQPTGQLYLYVLRENFP